MANGNNPLVVTTTKFSFCKKKKVTGAEEATEDYQEYGDQVCL